MIHIDTSDMHFPVHVVQEDDDLAINISCDSYMDDMLEIRGSVIVHDIVIKAMFDDYPIHVLVDLHMSSHGAIQNVMVVIIDSEILKEEIKEILEDYDERD